MRIGIIIRNINNGSWPIYDRVIMFKLNFEEQFVWPAQLKEKLDNGGQ